jgi:hypothetical protein
MAIYAGRSRENAGISVLVTTGGYPTGYDRTNLFAKVEGGSLR